MSILNGTYEFYFSEEQKEKAKKDSFESVGYYRPTLVVIPSDDPDAEGIEVGFTECVHLSNKNSKDWKDHDKRFEDSKKLGKVKDPYTRRGKATFKREGVS